VELVTYLSAEQILDADDLGVEDVDVPEWTDEKSGACTVRVRGMTGEERDRFESGFVGNDMKQLPKEKALEHYRARLAGACIIDAAGNRLFRSPAEIKRLSGKNATALQRVCDVASRLSGLSKKDEEELLGN
jgi:hypothetical protein